MSSRRGLMFHGGGASQLVHQMQMVGEIPSSSSSYGSRPSWSMMMTNSNHSQQQQQLMISSPAAAALMVSASSTSPSSSLSSPSPPSSSLSCPPYPGMAANFTDVPVASIYWQDNQLDHDDQQLPESWSQLLLGGLMDQDDHEDGPRHYSTTDDQYGVNNSGDGYAYLQHCKLVDDKAGNNMASHNDAATMDMIIRHDQRDHHHQHPWGQQAGAGPGRVLLKAAASSSSPKSSSCDTLASFNGSAGNILEFSNVSCKMVGSTRKHDYMHGDHRLSEFNKNNGSSVKKGRVQASSPQSPLKVRKEKLGDRIAALHQLVSPFGKTDTASVLLEAIGYIRFLQSQIEALSLPYLRNEQPRKPRELCVGNMCNRMMPKDTSQECVDGPTKDLRSRGLCLVPVPFTLQVSNDSITHYWPVPNYGGGFK